MDRQFVAMGERIPLIMMGGTEAQLLVVGNRPRYIRDHEDRLDTYDASHPETIRLVAYLCLCARPASENIPRTFAQAAVLTLALLELFSLRGSRLTMPPE